MPWRGRPRVTRHPLDKGADMSPHERSADQSCSPCVTESGYAPRWSPVDRDGCHPICHVRFWEQNGSGDMPGGAVRRGDHCRITTFQTAGTSYSSRVCRFVRQVVVLDVVGSSPIVHPKFSQVRSPISAADRALSSPIWQAWERCRSHPVLNGPEFMRMPQETLALRCACTAPQDDARASSPDG